MGKRFGLLLVGGVLFVAACSGNSGGTNGGDQGGSDEPLTVRVGAFPEPDVATWTLQVAEELGLFDEHGLDAQLSELPTEHMVSLLINEDIDIVCVGGDVYAAFLEGAELTTVMGSGSVLPYVLVAQEEYETITELKGQAIGSQGGTATSTGVVTAALEANSVGEDEVQWVEIGNPTRRAQALIGGRVAAAPLTYGEVLLVSQAPNIHVLDPNPGEHLGLKPLLTCVTRSDYAAEHQEELEAFTKGHIQAIRALHDDKDEFVRLAEEIIGGGFSQQEYEQLYEIQKSSGYLSVNGGLEPEWIEETLDYFREESGSSSEVTASDLYSDQFVKAALDELGTVPSDSDQANWYQQE